MKITDMLKREFVLEQLKAGNKRDALAELAGVFAQGRINVDPEAMLHVLLERERLGSTGIGDGIAIPHGKLPGLEEMVVSFGRSREGIAFEAMDGKPVHLFFLLMAPENSAGHHLKMLAKISRMLKDANFRKNLLETEMHEDLFRIIAEKDDET
ncbi:MAG: PTS sugar transporter subunit IIA [Proteobacteria bacterium]|nr:PTS sugar transporter subunit IIA [Pseudomonadota bacterium]MBU1745348.1 PTS sugar transporter subunit IIA [Pseudomonadota bacterium]MBU4370904.1 PTS sugar transporter subunit IIA [Pseudomonadota bacterium]MBU4582393.1 PTS sugar transporter subunit IIA [Pseudomonadota bacterium]MCG2741067.1 PTS sugar transporter subunit IIA [Syntrophaceae bacterium]